MAFPPIRKRGRSGSLSRDAAQATAPLHGATPTGGVTASRAKTRPLRHRRSAASRSECAAGARTARREARAPAGQPKDSAPSRSAAGKSATIDNSRSIAAGRQDRPCVSDRHRQAEKPKVARWSKPAQTGLRNRARCGLARRRGAAPHLLSTAAALNIAFIQGCATWAAWRLCCGNGRGNGRLNWQPKSALRHHRDGKRRPQNSKPTLERNKYIYARNCH